MNLLFTRMETTIQLAPLFAGCAKNVPELHLFAPLGLLFERKQSPQIVVNVRIRRKYMEPLEATRLPWAQASSVNVIDPCGDGLAHTCGTQILTDLTAGARKRKVSKAARTDQRISESKPLPLQTQIHVRCLSQLRIPRRPPEYAAAILSLWYSVPETSFRQHDGQHERTA